jgi:hypothetical protein
LLYWPQFRKYPVIINCIVIFLVNIGIIDFNNKIKGTDHQNDSTNEQKFIKAVGKVLVEWVSSLSFLN